MFKINGLDEEKTKTILFAFLAVINALTFKINAIAIAIGLIELTILFFEIIRNRIDRALLLLVFFLSTVIENSYFATGQTANELKLYSFLSLPFTRTYHILWIIGLLYILTITRRSNDKIGRLSRNLVLLWIAAFIVTIISILLNDNKVGSVWGLTRLVIVDGYNAFFTIGIFVVTLRILNKDDTFSERLRLTIISILKGVVIAAIILVIFRNTRRTDDGDLYLICPLILYWSPALLLFYKKRKKVAYIIYAMLSIIIQTRYTVGIPGAWWLSTGVICVVFAVKVMHEVVFVQKIKLTYVFSLAIVVVVIMGLLLALSTGAGSGSESYIIYKLGTAISIFKLSLNPMIWLEGMGTSVGIRVEQIANIFIELTKKPLYFLTGKGFGGTTLHHWGIYWWGRSGVYSDIQNTANVYSSFHTGMAEMIINFGAVGLLFVIQWIKNLIFAIFGKCNNPWIIVGSLFLLFFYSYYWSMSVCIVIMAYGVFVREKDIKNNMISN